MAADPVASVLLTINGCEVYRALLPSASTASPTLAAAAERLLATWDAGEGAGGMHDLEILSALMEDLRDAT